MAAPHGRRALLGVRRQPGQRRTRTLVAGLVPLVDRSVSADPAAARPRPRRRRARSAPLRAAERRRRARRLASRSSRRAQPVEVDLRPRGHRAASGAFGELARTVAGGLHRGEERGADLVDLELAQRGGGGAARRGDLLAQHDGVGAGLAEHLGRADERLDDQLGGGGARQAEVDAGLDHRLDDEEDVGRARSRRSR